MQMLAGLTCRQQTTKMKMWLDHRKSGTPTPVSGITGCLSRTAAELFWKQSLCSFQCGAWLSQNFFQELHCCLKWSSRELNSHLAHRRVRYFKTNHYCEGFESSLTPLGVNCQRGSSFGKHCREHLQIFSLLRITSTPRGENPEKGKEYF